MIEVEFGDGNHSIHTAYEEGDETETENMLVIELNSGDGTVGSPADHKIGKKIEGDEVAVQFVFRNKESVAVMIKQLQRIEESLAQV